MIDLKNAAKNDPVRRNVEKGLEQVEHTPLDPPDAYGENNDAADEKTFPEPLARFVHEHRETMAILETFEQSLLALKAGGYRMNDSINKAFGDFFRHFDDHLLPHNSREEKVLFPVLRQKLIAAGEHSIGAIPLTATDVMEDDHVKFIQLGALSFNLFGLATRIADPASRTFVLDTAYENARELIEIIKLHIWREDHTLFPLAKKYLDENDLAASVLLLKTTP